MFNRKLNVEVSQMQTIKQSVTVDDLRTGLLRSRTLDWLPPAISSLNILNEVKNRAPLAPDVAEWMQEAAVHLSVLEGAAADYDRAGSRIVVASGDGYIPGVSTTNMHAISQTGGTIRDQGQGEVMFGNEVYAVPTRGKTTMVGMNRLGWASLPNPGSGVQWTVNLMNWLELARAPIQSKVRFPGTGALVAPQFFEIGTLVPSPVVLMNIGVQSDKTQTINIVGRNTRDYRAKFFEIGLQVPQGENLFTVIVRGLPRVPPYLLEMQPEDNTETAVTQIFTRPA